MTDQPQGQEIELKAFSIESTTWKTHPEHHDYVKRHHYVDNEYDTQLSDMDGETFIVEPDGTVLWPYGRPAVGSVIDLLTPVLDLLPVMHIEHYLSARRARQRESEES